MSVLAPIIPATYYLLLKYVGAIVVGTQILRLTYALGRKVYNEVRERRGFGFQWKNLGKWAVVTGGTDGIGKAYVEELAEKGFHVCLISRNNEKLNSVAEEIAAKHKVSVKTIKADFTGGVAVYKAIGKNLKDLDGGIGVLVNNVGMSYECAEYFHAIPNGRQVMWDLIYSNVTSCTMMMNLVMPKMRNKGVIINISSISALFPMPLLTTYAACKAYVDYISRAVNYEYKDKGYLVQCVLPAYVATKMSKRRISLEIPSAKTYVSSAIKTVGTEDCTYGYFPHKVRGFVHQWLIDNMPDSFNLALSMHYMKKKRERYQKKIQRKLNENQISTSV